MSEIYCSKILNVNSTDQHERKDRKGKEKGK